MRRFLFAVGFSMTTLLLQGSVVHACVNDSDTYRTEREFRQNYEFKSGTQPQSAEPGSPTEPANNEPLLLTWGRIGLTGTGMVLMLATVGLVVHNFRRIGT